MQSSISSEWQFTVVSKAGLPSTSWTAATPHRVLPVISDFDLPAVTISSYHDIVAARSAVRRSPSPVRWPGMRCLATSETRRSVPTISGRAKDASVSECTWTLSALEALRNALYKFKTYLLTYLQEVAGSNLDQSYFAPRSTQPFIRPGSVQEYQLRLEKQRQVWLLIPLANEMQGVHWYPLTMRAIPERLRDVWRRYINRLRFSVITKSWM